MTPAELEYFTYLINNAPHHDKPAHALMLSLRYRDDDYEQSVKYASLTVEMVDSLDPSDLMGPFKACIADHWEFARDVYRSIIDNKYIHDEAYQRALNGYRAEQTPWENQMSEAIEAERKRVIGYFYPDN